MTNRLIGKSPIKGKTILLLPLLLTLLLSSCSSLKNVGLEKRHYRPGYYVSINSNGSLKAIPAANADANKKQVINSDYETIFTKRREKETETKVHSSSFLNNQENKVKSGVSHMGKKLANAVKDVGTTAIHKEKEVLKPKKADSSEGTKVRTEGKTYSLSTVAFVVGAILIIWGLSVLFASIPMMSADIALALTILIGLALVIIWGLIVLIIKSWFNGDNEPAKPSRK